MHAILYIPQQQPQSIDNNGLVLPDPISRLVATPERVSQLLGCAPALVDVLASGSNYVAYSIFDCEGQINQNAMEALSDLTGVKFGNNEDEILRGAVLVVCA